MHCITLGGHNVIDNKTKIVSHHKLSRNTITFYDKINNSADDYNIIIRIRVANSRWTSTGSGQLAVAWHAPTALEPAYKQKIK